MAEKRFMIEFTEEEVQALIEFGEVSYGPMCLDDAHDRALDKLRDEIGWEERK